MSEDTGTSFNSRTPGYTGGEKDALSEDTGISFNSSTPATRNIRTLQKGAGGEADEEEINVETTSSCHYQTSSNFSLNKNKNIPTASSNLFALAENQGKAANSSTGYPGDCNTSFSDNFNSQGTIGNSKRPNTNKSTSRGPNNSKSETINGSKSSNSSIGTKSHGQTANSNSLDQPD